ncbi:hydroxymethylpyrimidine/phosphomethylpyrimidine kinase [Flavobacterium sp. 5]|uniref:hydroxymethylpyrimidine/phosphomethylpyrimidine kinase n=1 Tax=Flavobacterium sp. 5 TaxID=2035199 RepID=UPI000C2BF672|nr:hydroxymethylpyrimidine/phosphomethylpyrimidine kinase [Flavobacterium sp. 5]PKB16238.1 hydroxymethylpyrimidine/phosphomethylpyrimidine kinase [Flavobacterium sp. 5]
MSANRPYVLTIAGFDPSAGAGVLADIKTFEQHGVYGFAINTANTIQTENEFLEIQWTDLSFVLESIKKLFDNYTIKVVKIGIIPSLEYLKEIVFMIKKLSSKTKIVWDTVLKSSTNFNFTTIENRLQLTEILNQIDLITPNYNEIKIIFPNFSPLSCFIDFLSPLQKEVSCSVLLKGGHNPNEMGVDYLYTENAVHQLLPKKVECFEKHGSGCVLSSAITANIALELNLKTACEKAKIYTENYLLSNSTKLGFHYV